MHLLDNYSQTFLTTNQERNDKQRENFKIATFSLVSSKLNMGIQNTGDIPINITRLWVQNTTASGDWFRTYTVNTVVSPGATASNIGQSLPLYIDSAKSYNIKLVTERGNSQQFAVNSPSSAPLNIQLLALPAATPSGLTAELVMIVTNNGSSTLTNISPEQPFNPPPTGSALCTYGTAKPPKYDVLPPGGTATFTWDVVVSGQPNDSCTFTANIKNGYPGNTATAKFTVTTLKVTSTDWATNTGIMTIQYTSFQWSQGNNQWNKSWQLSKSNPTVFSLNVTNNNATSGSNFYMSSKTSLVFHQIGNSGDLQFFVVNGVDITGSTPTINTPYTCTGPPTDDFCVNIPPKGWKIVYFGAKTSSGTTVGSFPSTGQDLAYLAVFGKYASSQSASGNEYAQNLPYIALNIP